MERQNQFSDQFLDLSSLDKKRIAYQNFFSTPTTQTLKDGTIIEIVGRIFYNEGAEQINYLVVNYPGRKFFCVIKNDELSSLQTEDQQAKETTALDEWVKNENQRIGEALAEERGTGSGDFISQL